MRYFKQHEAVFQTKQSKATNILFSYKLGDHLETTDNVSYYQYLSCNNSSIHSKRVINSAVFVKVFFFFLEKKIVDNAFSPLHVFQWIVHEYLSGNTSGDDNQVNKVLKIRRVCLFVFILQSISSINLGVVFVGWLVGWLVGFMVYQPL